MNKHFYLHGLSLYMVFHKNNSFFFFHSLLIWWPIVMKFLPIVAEEVLIQNILTKYGSWLNILC